MLSDQQRRELKDTNDILDCIRLKVEGSDDEFRSSLYGINIWAKYQRNGMGNIVFDASIMQFKNFPRLRLVLYKVGDKENPVVRGVVDETKTSISNYIVKEEGEYFLQLEPVCPKCGGVQIVESEMPEIFDT